MSQPQEPNLFDEPQERDDFFSSIHTDSDSERVIVEFTVLQLPYCRRYSKVLQRVARQLAMDNPQVRVVRADCNALKTTYEEIKNEYEVFTFPTYVCFQSKKSIGKLEIFSDPPTNDDDNALVRRVLEWKDKHVN